MPSQDPSSRAGSITEFYGLGLDQGAVDFVDVDVVADTRLFLDPRALRLLETPWANSCVAIVQTYFAALLAAVHAGDRAEGTRLLNGLNEPNETRLGMSRKQARGRGVGRRLSDDLWSALAASDAAKSNLLQDLEDTVLFIDNVGLDRISDITTNLIRAPLMAYTQEMCEVHAIPMEEVDAGFLWDEDSQSWDSHETTLLPTPLGRRLVLVPKSIVRIKLDFDPGDYYRNYILEFLRDRELTQRTELVRLIKKGRERVVYKKDVVAKYRRMYGTTKQQVIQITKENPVILDDYREAKKRRAAQRPPLEDTTIALRAGSKPPDYKALLSAVTNCPSGTAAAARYHKAVMALLNVLFYPDLMYGDSEVKLNQGRKRIDIRYVNMPGDHFFAWLRANWPPAPYVSVECKNYTNDPANPELDQLIARFSRLNGHVGVFVCRALRSKPLFIARCGDAAKAGQGFILPLDDGDLEMLCDARATGAPDDFGRILHGRFAEVVA
jgi:hypothetical protein